MFIPATCWLCLSLPSDETILLGIFCASGLLVINFLSLFLSWNIPILFYLTDSFAGYTILGWQLWSFRAWNVSFHTLMALEVPVR